MGALDGTAIKVTVPTHLKGRYRSRKADIVTNVLGVCAPDMQFIYMLPGWEGSAHDGRVLRDAINMCHARARNIIERAFGRLKGRWAILRSPSYFPIKTQCRIIMACALLHNLILQKNV